MGRVAFDVIMMSGYQHDGHQHHMQNWVYVLIICALEITRNYYRLLPNFVLQILMMGINTTTWEDRMYVLIACIRDY